MNEPTKDTTLLDLIDGGEVIVYCNGRGYTIDEAYEFIETESGPEVNNMARALLRLLIGSYRKFDKMYDIAKMAIDAID